MATPSLPHLSSANNLVPRLKRAVFDLFLTSTASEAQDAPCSNYNEDGSCFEQGASLCPGCAAYERSVEQFNAIPVG
jgi:hypothetical protein